jgi:hypothetical protein
LRRPFEDPDRDIEIGSSIGSDPVGGGQMVGDHMGAVSVGGFHRGSVHPVADCADAVEPELSSYSTSGLLLRRADGASSTVVTAAAGLNGGGS